MLTPEDQKRHSRQIMLPAIGPEGQARLGRSRLAVVGCGGLGSVLSQLMVRMGVGRVTVIDGDRPDITNLHRQICFDEADVAAGHPKAQSACEKLRRINSRAEIVLDLWDGSQQRIPIRRNPECTCCGQQRLTLLNR